MTATSPEGTAGLLLTGGASRRMGRPKAAIVGVDGQTLAGRTAALLATAAAPAFEVGPGFSGLPHVQENPPGSGPLAAIVCGRRALASAGWEGPVLVVATDLPRLTQGLMAWLARYPSLDSVLPVFGGHPQPLCARYSAADLCTADEVWATGSRAMQALLAAIRPQMVSDDEWRVAAGDAAALADADTPADLDLLQP